MAAVLLGVVEPWLSPGAPIRPGLGSGASAALICAPQPGVRRETYQEPRSGPRSSSGANTPGFSCRPSTMFSASIGH